MHYPCYATSNTIEMHFLKVMDLNLMLRGKEVATACILKRNLLVMRSGVTPCSSAGLSHLPATKETVNLSPYIHVGVNVILTDFRTQVGLFVFIPLWGSPVQ